MRVVKCSLGLKTLDHRWVMRKASYNGSCQSILTCNYVSYRTCSGGIASNLARVTHYHEVSVVFVAFVTLSRQMPVQYSYT
jgi:hypothetical protein